MSIRFNHMLVYARDKKASAAFLTDVLGLLPATPFGPFLVVELENGASLDFIDVGDADIVPQHYAFLIDEEDFDEIFERIRARGLAYWADPFKKRPSEINRNDGGRGVYFEEPDCHFLEVLTRPYGSGQSRAYNKPLNSARPTGGHFRAPGAGACANSGPLRITSRLTSASS